MKIICSSCNQENDVTESTAIGAKCVNCRTELKIPADLTEDTSAESLEVTVDTDAEVEEVFAAFDKDQAEDSSLGSLDFDESAFDLPAASTPVADEINALDESMFDLDDSASSSEELAFGEDDDNSFLSALDDDTASTTTPLAAATPDFDEAAFMNEALPPAFEDSVSNAFDDEAEDMTMSSPAITQSSAAPTLQLQEITEDEDDDFLAAPDEDDAFNSVDDISDGFGEYTEEGTTFADTDDFASDEFSDTFGDDTFSGGSFDDEPAEADSLGIDDIAEITEDDIEIIDSRIKLSLLGQAVCSLVFFVLLWVGSQYYLSRNYTELNTVSIEKASSAIVSTASSILTFNSERLAADAEEYIRLHPELSESELFRDPNFREMVFKPIGNTGYSALYSLPSGKGNGYFFRVHPSQLMADFDIDSIKGELTDAHRILTSVTPERSTSGAYTWKEADGSFSNKMMSCTIIPGTDFAITSTAYDTELVGDLLSLPAEMEAQMKEATKLNITISLIVLSTVLSVVLLSVRSFIIRIRKLVTATELMSVGDFSAEIDTSSVFQDEFSHLAGSIVALKTSIEEAIKRLRQR